MESFDTVGTAKKLIKIFSQELYKMDYLIYEIRN